MIFSTLSDTRESSMNEKHNSGTTLCFQRRLGIKPIEVHFFLLLASKENHVRQGVYLLGLRYGS